MATKRAKGKPTKKGAATSITTARTSPIVDTRVIYRGDNLEQLKNCWEGSR